MKNRKGIHKIPLSRNLSSVLHGPERKKMSGNIFEIIKSIQKIDRKILPHTEKNLLISIAIHLGDNGHIWATNQQMGERIGESKDYVKNIVMRLKCKQFIKIKGRHKERKIYLNEAKILGNSQLPKRKSIGNSQLPKRENGNSQLPTGNSQLPAYIKEKEKNKTKEKSGATPDSFNFWHPYIDEIMAAMPKQAKGKISRAFINEHLKKKGGDRPYFYWVFDHATDKPDPVKWITMGIRGYYGAYLKSDEYKTAGDIGGHEMMTPLNCRD